MQSSSQKQGSLNPVDRERIGRHFSLISTIFAQLMGAESTNSTEKNAFQQMGEVDQNTLESIDGVEIRVDGSTTYITFEPSLDTGFNELNEPLTITLNDGDRSPPYKYILKTAGSSDDARDEE